jgi:hypothetical protein
VRKDARGLVVTGADGAVIEAIDRFTLDLIGARDEAVAMLAVAERHPECALVQTYAAALHAYSQSQAEIDTEGRRFLARAQSTGTALTEREQALIDAVAAWLAADFQAGIDLHERMAREWPQDVVAAKFAEFLFYLAPDYHRHLRFMQRVAAANADLSDFKAMHAFALELTGDYRQAEDVANEAIQQQLHTPWAHHALAHIHLNEGRIDEGIAVQQRFQPTWEAHMQTIRGHNSWHLALLHLARLELDPVRELYRARVAGFQPDAVVEHIDAISLLWRVELAGGTVTDEWAALADRIIPRANEQVFPFLSAHYLYCLVRGGRTREAGAALARIRRYAERQTGHNAQVWGEVGVPLAEGCVAFAQGHYARAVQRLEPIQPALVCVGGSDAQNDLFRQTYLLALIESKAHAKAADLLARRHGSRQPTPLAERWLGRA